MGVKKKTTNKTIKRSAQRSALKLRKQSAGERQRNQASPAREQEVPELKELIWQAVAMIPKGKVASYGQIAKLIGFPAHSRYVGTTLRNLPKGSKLPWFRVVNSTLRISQRGGGEARQRKLLEADGVTFVGNRVAKAHRWDAE